MGILGTPRRAARTVILLVALAFALPALAQDTIEVDVKAAFLFNFTKFVDWPTPGATAEPFRLCVVSDETLRRSVERTIEGETVNGRPLRFLAPRTAEEARSCQLLFVGKADGAREASLLAAVRDLPVLTVSDTADFARRGGGIEFVRENNRLRFDVNVPGAEKGGIKVSSRLLRVARRVHESPTKK